MNSLKLVYRNILKGASLKNSKKYRIFIEDELNSLKSTENNDLSVINLKIEEFERFANRYITSKRFIEEENRLLTVYNINVVRDASKKIRNTAHYVGLDLPLIKNH